MMRSIRELDRILFPLPPQRHWEGRRRSSERSGFSFPLFFFLLRQRLDRSASLSPPLFFFPPPPPFPRRRRKGAAPPAGDPFFTFSLAPVRNSHQRSALPACRISSFSPPPPVLREDFTAAALPLPFPSLYTRRHGAARGFFFSFSPPAAAENRRTAMALGPRLPLLSLLSLFPLFI